MASRSPILSAKIDPFLDPEKHTPSSPSSKTVARSLLRQLLHTRHPRLSSLHFLLPSFLQPHHRRQLTCAPSSTAWLDGMRGLASFFVYIRHFASATHPNIQVGYGTNPQNTWIIQLPFLRLLVAGPAMVSLFFIISGYALSWSPLKALHANQGGKGGAEAALLRLSSATFRRAARLFLPAIASTLLVALCITLGLYDRGHASMTPADMPGFREPEPPQWRANPWYVQLQDWVRVTWGFLKVWTPGGHSYDVHLWTLPVEFRCSIILFASLVGLVRCGVIWRGVGLAAMVVYCYYTDFWQGWLFFAGSFLAQIRFIQLDGREVSSASGILPIESNECTTSSPTSKRISRLDALRLLLFTLGLFLLSAPDYGHASSAPMYITLSQHLTPASWPESWRFLHCLGGFLAVYATSSSNTNILRRLFDNPISSYLGNISYALYLVHGPLVHMLGFWLVPWMWGWLGREGEVMDMWRKEVGFAYAFVVMTVVSVWVADLFWRGVDMNCVRVAKWVEGRVVEK
jgi:peptidoglycan/LPS O-acetylase OafA/YrhL